MPGLTLINTNRCFEILRGDPICKFQFVGPLDEVYCMPSFVSIILASILNLFRKFRQYRLEYFSPLGLL